MNKKYYSTNITPVIVYENCDQDKVQILNDNRNKGGVYC